jgi:ABC-2 type transport system ATP-binding protein
MPIAITTRNLSRRFGNVIAVDGVDLDIPSGQVFGFLGPNGSGKSTLIRMLCGLLIPTAGEVEVLGLSIPAKAEALKLKTGYMTQSYSLYRDLSVAENLDFVADIYGLSHRAKRVRVEQLISQYWLEDIRHQISGSLSGGQRQRLALAAAVIHQPPLLFLDEPTSAVDPQSRRDFWESLFELVEQGTTILVSTHFMDEAERCHRLAILDQGKKVADGAPEQLMANIDVHVVEVHTVQVARAKDYLSEKSLVVGVAQLGLSLRVLIDRTVEFAVPLVQQFLQEIQVDAEVVAVKANLEDVFVVVTQAREKSGLGVGSAVS